jgi:hypothetical protein
LLSAPQPDEVVEVFSGDTLEEAMAHAVATLGPDLTVRRARRVRKGVHGLRGKERYEVVAVPPPRSAGDAVGNAFEALLEQAEREEDTTSAPARLAAVPVVLEELPEIAPVIPAPVAQVFDQELLAPSALEVTPPTPPARRPASPRPTAAPASRRTARKGWSRTALTRVGIPGAVLAALPPEDPEDDLGWVSAVTTALTTALPAPDPAAAVVVNGRGIEGVLGILNATRNGLTPGTITYAGRTAPATALELALAIRAEVLR